MLTKGDLVLCRGLTAPATMLRAVPEKKHFFKASSFLDLTLTYFEDIYVFFFLV